MFRTLRRLFGYFRKEHGGQQLERNATATGESAFAQLDDAVPLKEADGVHAAFVRREAVLNRDEKIAGYEFSLLTTLQSRLRRRGGAARRAYDIALLSRLTLTDVPSLLGHRMAFISISPESLDSPLIHDLPTQNTVLMLDVTEQQTDWNATRRMLDELKAKGFSSGLQIHQTSDILCPLIGGLDFVQIDVAAFDGIDLNTMMQDLRQRSGKGTHQQLVARDVQSHDDFLLCERCGFDYFQGAFVTTRESWQPASGGINRVVVLQVMQLLRKEANFSDVALELTNEPTLTYKLLRYLNSAAIGLQQPTNSITQALVILGREKFYRWMSLLLFHFTDPGYRERLLTENALARGRTLELLAGHGKIPATPDTLFLTGLFSLLDVALGRPMAELLAAASVPLAVSDALLGRTNAHAEALAMAIAGEADSAASPAQFASALDTCGITDQGYASAAAEALTWASEITGAAE